jgi:nucleotide-binding universal stress UspA family protein
MRTRSVRRHAPRRHADTQLGTRNSALATLFCGVKEILVAVDFSDVTVKVIKVAAHLAGPFQSRVILMHVSETPAQMVAIGAAPDVVPVPPPTQEPEFDEAAHTLDRLRELLTSAGLESVAIELKGPPIDHIIAKAESARVDLIILGSHNRGPLYHLFAGGVIDGILKRARCPVLIVPLSESTL